MLELFNSLGKKLQPFRPVDPECVTIFTCGPSVYQRSHIGNFRTFLFEDVLVKYLQYSGYPVKRGMNFTDIEDKAVAEARKKKTSLKSLTEKNIQEFLKESAMLKIQRPDYLPRATESIDEAVRIINALLKKGGAYWHRGNVYFDPLKFNGFGQIYGLDMSKWPKKKVRFSKDTYPGMRWNLGDFILWHGCRGQDIECWDAGIGPGRPAWNIQDAAIVSRHFDETLSVYCGGIDNLIRHHDYTRAVLESVRPYPMARFWLHCRHLYVDGRKMSKSTDNILYTDDLMNRGYSPAEIRFFLIYNHYRERIDYSEKNMLKAMTAKRSLSELAGAVARRSGRNAPADSPRALSLKRAFTRSMNNDLNVADACDAVIANLRTMEVETLPPGEAAAILKALRKIDRVLGAIF